MPQLKSSLHVLLAEDDDDLRDILIEDLSAYHFKVTACANGAEAVKVLESDKATEIDVILSDIKMPGSDGFVILDWLQAKKQHSPLIFLSSFADQTSIFKAFKGGAYDILEKPYDLLKLIHTATRAAHFGRLQRNHAALLKITKSCLGESPTFKALVPEFQQIENDFSNLNKLEN